MRARGAGAEERASPLAARGAECSAELHGPPRGSPEPSAEQCSATPASPRRSWTSSSRCGDEGRLGRRSPASSRTVRASRRTSTSKSARLPPPAQPAARRARGASSAATSSCGAAAEPVGVHAVDDQPRARASRARRGARARKRASRDRLGLGRGDDQEGRLGSRSSSCDAARALAEAVDHARQRAEERRQVARACPRR